MKKNDGNILWMALAAAGLCLLALPSIALAGDGPCGASTSGDASKTACGDGGGCGGAERAPGCQDGDAACEKQGSLCGKCVDGAKEGKACCLAKVAAANLEVVSLAVLEGEGAGAKAVLAAVPEESAKAVADARAETLKGLVQVRRSMNEIRKEKKAVCEEAKAAGTEVSCEVTAAYDADLKAMEKKARALLGALAAVVKGAVGESRVETLAAEVRKSGDVAKAVAAKIQAEAEKAPAETAPAAPATPAPGCDGTGVKT